MKIQELRIGNLVKCKTSNDSAIYSVIQIDGFGLKVRLSHPRHTEFTPLDRIKPIPLTEEILLKCGFEKDDTGVDMFDPDYAEWYQMEFPVIGILCQSSDKKYLFDENTDTLRIQYLHQLQNLVFDLTGEELEVEL